MWKNPPLKLSLPHNEVHIWRASLEQPAYHDLLASTLSTDEQARAGRFYFEQDRTAFAIGRGLLRWLIGGYLQQEPTHLHFQYGASGKPSLEPSAGKPLLAFNVSHSRYHALYAFAWSRQTGVDLEYIRDVPQAQSIARRFFSPREQQAFFALPPDQQKTGFFNCWTRKEAYLKARGLGLSQSLTSVQVSLAPSKSPTLLALHDDDPSRWSLRSLHPWAGFVGALVVEGHDWHLCCLDGDTWLQQQCGR